ncbi:isopenicillin N synthase family oxygenase [Caenimonas sedimenti]|uniref:2-oxoglutarate-dependent ethylene/succinate-forming enzyme n=1 Tax=Caenimonas sedimenti TaxID=2596921 RepID=A0A562ZP47_9BURK|nr:2-oxoglutarate and iron-dependent oxygenase domain-containing protein [Caenimonas sedimenti]TWO70340.1 isopenicillin N synthase family oxygenase [Caenimonas sedimenti]
MRAQPPLVDVSALVDPHAGMAARAAAARDMDAAARSWGFFYVSGHGVDARLVGEVERLARAFFALDEAEKMRIPMAAGGTAWRGFFPAGGELTSGRPDWKEGLYLGSELPPEHPRVRDGVILHGPNLWPAIPGFRETVLAYIDALEALGHALMRGCALGLGLPESYFDEHGTHDPLLLLRFFNYPTRPAPEDVPAAWGVGEHTDYGLLTILWQDDVGGLQVRKDEDWFDAPPIAGTFVCNIGDMLDRMTGGRYRSVPHRVAINTSGRDRLSIPLFFDPDFDTVIAPVPGAGPGQDDSGRRWDGANLQAFHGTYGDYVTAKVGKVFPELRRSLPKAG